jgi:nucleotide-binding universal stress UspA family protein
MKTILVPVDFSKNSHNALLYALGLAKAFRSKIILMHSYETALAYVDSPMMALPVDYSLFQERAKKDLDSYFKKVSKIADGVSIEPLLIEGRPSEKVKEVAKSRNVNLIVVGTTGKGALERIMIGSNASAIIVQSDCPVFAIPPQAKFKGITHIVYGTDLTDDNLIHAKKVIPFAKMFDAELSVLYVNTHILDGPADNPVDISKKIKKHIHYSKSSGYICNDVDVSKGINFFLKREKADCLAVYTHHRTWFESIFKPSITKNVAIHTTVPLLSIHDHQ